MAGDDRDRTGRFGRFSAAGFVTPPVPYLLDPFVAGRPAFWTLVVAPVAGGGALAPYFGRDPTAGQRRGTTA